MDVVVFLLGFQRTSDVCRPERLAVSVAPGWPVAARVTQTVRAVLS